MPQQLHPAQVDLLRKLNKTALVFMLLFLLDRPVGESEIAILLQISPKTARTHLKSLARQGVVTRTQRYQGWTLTAGGRQMILGESAGEPAVEQLPGVHVAELPGENCETSDQNYRSTGNSYRSSGKNDRSLPVAAASLSLSFKEESKKAAAAKAGAGGKNYRSNGKNYRSLLRPRIRKVKDADRTANGSGKSEPMIQQNLRAFASIGLAQNDYVLRICRMDHVTPAYILGQKKRLEAERRYSPGLLLRVIQCRDDLPAKYVGNRPENPPQPPLIRGEQNPPERRFPSPHPFIRGATERAQLLEGEMELEEEDGGLEIEPDPSIHEPLSGSSITAAKAWPAVLRELQRDMPRAAYDRFARDAVLLSARDGTFVIGAQSGYARDWLESRLASTVRRLLAGICNRSMEVRFVDLAAAGQYRTPVIMSTTSE